MKIPPLAKTYGRRTVLETDGMELLPGRIYALIGPNGSGKSTFARIVAGVLPPDGKRSFAVPDTVVRYMPQKSYPFRMSVEKNILMAGGSVERAAELMEMMNLSSLKNQKISSLSGGETARMAFARVLMKPCDLLILDEPTAAMDMESAIAAETLLKEYRESVGCAVLLITHDIPQARRLADEVLFFYQGHLYEQGKASVILHAPEKDVTRRFLEYYGSTPDTK